jgi:hypothetical protein
MGEDLARENERLKQKSIVSSMVRMMPRGRRIPPRRRLVRLAEPSFFLLHLPGCLPYLCRDFRNCGISSHCVDRRGLLRQCQLVQHLLLNLIQRLWVVKYLGSLGWDVEYTPKGVLSLLKICYRYYQYPKLVLFLLKNKIFNQTKWARILFSIRLKLKPLYATSLNPVHQYNKVICC